MEAVGSHIQVRYRRTIPTASWQRLSRKRCMEAVGSQIQVRNRWTFPTASLAEAVKKEMEAVGSHIQVRYRWTFPTASLAEAVKKEMEAVGSHIQVRYRWTFLTVSLQRLSRRRWRLWDTISRHEPFLLLFWKLKWKWCPHTVKVVFMQDGTEWRWEHVGSTSIPGMPGTW